MPYDEPIPPPLPGDRAPNVRPGRKASLTPLYVALTIVAMLVAAGLGYLARGWDADPQPKKVALQPAPAKKSEKKPTRSAPKVQPAPTIANEPSASPQEPDPAGDLATPAEKPVARPAPVEEPKPASATTTPPETKPSEVVPTPATPVPPESKPSTPTPSRPEQKTPTLYQELDIQRMPKLGMLGTVTVQDLRYRILSQLKVTGPDDDGQLAVDQVVLDTKLIKSDDLSRAMFESSLAALKGWQFSYKLSGRREVTEWKASPPDGRKAAAVEAKGAKGFLVTSVMDEDGWKELAQLSFFQPQQTGGSKSWRRPMQHNFGPLGSWYGETQFTPQQTRDGVQQIAFVHKMEYRPPEKDLGELPFTVENAMLKPEAAGGTIQYDAAAGRVQSAQEGFHVRGALGVSLLGQSASVEVEEQQVLTLRLHEQNPRGTE